MKKITVLLALLQLIFSSLAFASDTWPTTAPLTAVESIFSWYSDSFTIYVWREQGAVWIRVEPITEGPFVCSGSFSVVQNLIQYDSVRLKTISGTNQCGDVFLSATYKFTETSANPPDLSKSFSLYFDGGSSGLHTLEVPVSADMPIADAGEDQIIPGNSVVLDGSNSSSLDGTIVTWEWTLDHLAASAYNKSVTGEMPTVVNLEHGNYIVTLTVTDDDGNTGTDEMFLSVAASNLKYTQLEYEQAQQSSYSEGHTAGYTEGHDAGYTEGQTAGYSEGHTAGYTEGQTAGYSAGHTAGYSAGYDLGFTEGEKTIAVIIHEDVNGFKVIDGPLIVNGSLTIE